jgi:hypothetical protein
MLYFYTTSDVCSTVILPNFTFIQINYVVLVSNEYILNEVNLFDVMARLVQ